MPTNAFLGVFAKSPIKPMEEHIKKVAENGSKNNQQESDSSDGEIDLKVIKKVVKKVREEG